mgnify:CR=1 FL=1
MGFGEIQFDYIRFPEPYKSLPPQVFPESNGRNKTDALAEFLKALAVVIARGGLLVFRGRRAARARPSITR